MKTVIGIDLSLKNTGVAGRTWCQAIPGPALHRDATDHDKAARLIEMRSNIHYYIDDADLVIVEGLSYGSNQPSSDERHYLYWWLAIYLRGREIPRVVVAPATLKVYATGSGRAPKDQVLRDVRSRSRFTVGTHDEADALTLAAMGTDWLGDPVWDLKQTHRRALQSVTWPETLVTA